MCVSIELVRRVSAVMPTFDADQPCSRTASCLDCASQSKPHPPENCQNVTLWTSKLNRKSTDAAKLIDEYEGVFEGIGCLDGKHHIKVDSSVTFVSIMIAVLHCCWCKLVINFAYEMWLLAHGFLEQLRAFQMNQDPTLCSQLDRNIEGTERISGKHQHMEEKELILKISNMSISRQARNPIHTFLCPRNQLDHLPTR